MASTILFGVYGLVKHTCGGTIELLCFDVLSETLNIEFPGAQEISSRFFNCPNFTAVQPVLVGFIPVSKGLLIIFSISRF